MKLETYLKNREIFINRYINCKDEHAEYFGLRIWDIKKGIRQFQLFIQIFTYDMRPTFSNIVSSIDRKSRVKVNGKSQSKIKLSRCKSLVDADPLRYIHMLNSAKRQIGTTL